MTLFLSSGSSSRLGFFHILAFLSCLAIPVSLLMSESRAWKGVQGFLGPGGTCLLQPAARGHLIVLLGRPLNCTFRFSLCRAGQLLPGCSLPAVPGHQEPRSSGSVWGEGARGLVLAVLGRLYSLLRSTAWL